MHFFFPDCMTTSSQSFSSKFVLNDSCVCNPYVMTGLKIYLGAQVTWLGTIRNSDYYIFYSQFLDFNLV